MLTDHAPRWQPRRRHPLLLEALLCRLPAGAGPGIVSEIELCPVEKENSNFACIQRLAAAWGQIQYHDVCQGIQSEMPLSIADAADSGSQRPFELDSYRRALAGGSQTYTAGINLFWIDLQWCATPGVPLRISSIDQMAKPRSSPHCQSMTSTLL